MGTAEESTSYPTKRSQAKKAIDAVTKAKGTAAKLTQESGKRIKSITDAVGNTAVISYNTDGRIASITNPSAPNGGAYNKNAHKKAHLQLHKRKPDRHRLHKRKVRFLHL